MPPTPSAPITTPGLTALVVYQRPAPRHELLSALANLGVFVAERQGVPGPECGPHDFCLLVARPRDDVEVAQVLLSRHRTLMVALPPAADHAEYVAAGALCCIGDDQLGDAAILAEAAQRARALRALPEAVPPARVFGSLRFHADRDLLEGDGSAVLSASERAVLAMLSRSPGRPVPHAELEGGLRKGLNAGLVKAVVLRLRRKAAGLGGDPGLLRPIRGFGYVLIG